MAEKENKCQRAWPCRYRDARQCAHDTMLGDECPKVCDCDCHAARVTEAQGGKVELAEIAVAAALLIVIAVVFWHTYGR